MFSSLSKLHTYVFVYLEQTVVMSGIHVCLYKTHFVSSVKSDKLRGKKRFSFFILISQRIFFPFFSSNVYERCGIVAVLLNKIQRMNYENGHINIVEIVKLMKATNKNIIKSYVRDKLSSINLSFQHQHAILTQFIYIIYSCSLINRTHLAPK